jgi:hypothetical protein
MKVKLLAFFVVGALLISGLTYMASATVNRPQSAIVAGAVSTVATHLSMHPTTALDLAEVSGEYCINAKLGKGGMMVHFAIDPETTKEDIISFYNAEPFLKAGLNKETFRRFCGKLGCMESDVWYFIPAGAYEPHHGVKFPFPLIVKAMDIV